MTDVIIVESPAKAKTINKYLGNKYTVVASLGHVRDLPPKDGSVRPDENFAMDWQADERGNKQIKLIAKALKGAQTLYLATDPDREGEAISWHVRSMLEEKNLLRNINVERITFNEITRQAVQHAIKHPRDLDQPLIEAYLARRALDYLVGFTLSPILWRKLPGSRSAGRVQSVALRLICEREAEIEVFQSKEYWTITGQFKTLRNIDFSARLTHFEGKKLEQFDLANESITQNICQEIIKTSYAVQSIERKQTKRNPSPPFTTSTLQQEASRKLHMSAQTTMRTAQQLYEGIDLQGETVGLITYMRTDGVQLANEAIESIRTHIGKNFGKNYLPGTARKYVSKAKNAQEAHEAIRPTSIDNTPDHVAAFLTPEQKKLYELIWKRAVASQMQSAVIDQVAAVLSNPNQTALFRATGSVIAFDGFLKLYKESSDDTDKDKHSSDASTLLPTMKEGEEVSLNKLNPEQHFTQPPARYSEASLVKKMEELGIGRPSTYASILGVLRDRDYVALENRYFIPQNRGRLVTAFLTSFFKRYVDVDFTANLEERLDNISNSKLNWKTVLQEFWQDFSKAIEQTKDLKISDVIDALDKDLEAHFFAPSPDNPNPRKCPACTDGILHLKLGRYGSFIGCVNYPECQYTRKLIAEESNDNDEKELIEGTKLLGKDPQTDKNVYLKKGPWGLYLQLGDTDSEDKNKKPKRSTIPFGTNALNLSLEDALALLSLPKQLGPHPKTQETIQAGLGRFGPYLKMGGIFASLKKGENILDITLNQAVEVIDQKLATIRTLGLHTKDNNPILLRKGRFGFYLQHNKTIANLPKDKDETTLSLEEAMQLLKDKGKTPSGGKKKPSTTKNKVTVKKTKKV
ncbi:DNA topoisomerase 1 [Commensalibacter sp. Nvir]|uniref:type I DNA topoisomerase n=1 Tax=Commensalibacter sp. Nvir TaxID=3069817 RepID=UPI002D3AA2FB|nr:DNA topoisomerase 1 [Commensalibacter sp. Nvir]